MQWSQTDRRQNDIYRLPVCIVYIRVSHINTIQLKIAICIYKTNLFTVFIFPINDRTVELQKHVIDFPTHILYAVDRQHARIKEITYFTHASQQLFCDARSIYMQNITTENKKKNIHILILRKNVTSHTCMLFLYHITLQKFAFRR